MKVITILGITASSIATTKYKSREEFNVFRASIRDGANLACKDNPEYRNPLTNKKCVEHVNIKCELFLHVGMSGDQVDELLSECPISCNSCVTTSSVSSFASLKPSSHLSMPSTNPSQVASSIPSVVASLVPSTIPTLIPSILPSSFPSSIPSIIPSTIPSTIPSIIPSEFPSRMNSTKPSIVYSHNPSVKPSNEPSITPSTSPSILPSHTPTTLPSTIPSSLPSIYPTTIPSLTPSSYPTINPSQSINPTTNPTRPSYYTIYITLSIPTSQLNNHQASIVETTLIQFLENYLNQNKLYRITILSAVIVHTDRRLQGYNIFQNITTIHSINATIKIVGNVLIGELPIHQTFQQVINTILSNHTNVLNQMLTASLQNQYSSSITYDTLQKPRTQQQNHSSFLTIVLLLVCAGLLGFIVLFGVLFRRVRNDITNDNHSPAPPV